MTMEGKYTKVNIALSYVKELVDRITPLIGSRLSLRTEKQEDKNTTFIKGNETDMDKITLRFLKEDVE